MGEIFAYVGTYTSKDGGEIYIYRMNPDSGALELVEKVKTLPNPSFLAVDSKHQNLYAVNEIMDFLGERAGAVSAFSIDGKNGKIFFLNSKSSRGAGPCHISLDVSDRYIFVANYAGGSVCMLPRNQDGSLGDAASFVQHKGSSINPERQEGPHPHSVVIDPANRHAYVPDLGLDKIIIYELDLEKGKLKQGDQPWVSTKPGSGPRHFTFHPNGRFAYLVNELDSTVVAYAYNERDGSLREIQVESTLPSDFKGENYAADIHASPSGKFLYASNRGHDSLAVFRVDGENGFIETVGHVHTQGRWPRNFAIDPYGTFILVANQYSDSIVSFRVDDKTGMPKPTGHVAHVPAPACVKIVPLK
ncbi:MAG: lactonase family protein [Candidatus Bathyarchaeia archaeon]